MAKAANYYITAVWKDSNKVITDVYLHTVNENGSFKAGIKTSESKVIALIKGGSRVVTLWWDYKSPGFKTGKQVGVVKEGNKEYLRTEKDATVVDNLDNLIIGTIIGS